MALSFGFCRLTAPIIKIGTYFWSQCGYCCCAAFSLFTTAERSGNSQKKQPETQKQMAKIQNEAGERARVCKGEGQIETYNCVAVAKANAGKVFHFFVPCRWKPAEVVLQFSRDYK